MCTKFWEQIFQFIKSNIQLDTTLDEENNNILFNTVHPVRTHIVNMMVLLAKQHIYRCRCFKVESNANTFFRQLNMIYMYKAYYAKMKNVNFKHIKKWKPLYQHLDTPTDEIQSDDFISEQVTSMSQ